MPTATDWLTLDQQETLLKLARLTAAETLGHPAANKNGNDSIPGRYGGLFVTFWNQADLRGCVGALTQTEDLVQTVPHVTKASLADRRFSDNPIHSRELDSLRIEISVLSELARTTDPLSLAVGTHGILIRRGRNSGCFLPKVAAERGWSTHDFLTNCCELKAGLDAQAWTLPDTEVYSFTALVFSEDAAKMRDRIE